MVTRLICLESILDVISLNDEQVGALHDSERLRLVLGPHHVPNLAPSQQDLGPLANFEQAEDAVGAQHRKIAKKN